MGTVWFKSLSAAAGLAVGIAGCDVARDVPQYTIEEFMGSTEYLGASFSPDGSKLLVSHNGSEIFNAYALPIDGGEPIQLTWSTDNAIRAVSYFNDDERFLYTADEGGNELNHVYVQDPAGRVTDLTPGENVTAAFAGWSGDHQSFYIQSNERDPRYFDVYRYDVADGYPREMVFRNDEGLLPDSLSEDGRYLALIASRTFNDNDLYVQDLVTGTRIHVTPHEGNVLSWPNDFSKNSRYLYYTTDEGGEFQRLMRHDLERGGKEEVVAEEWDVMYGYFSRDEDYLIVGINNDARTVLRVYETATMEQVPLPDVPGADITSVSFSHGDETMALYASGSRFPGDIFVQSMQQGSEARQLTQSLHENIESDLTPTTAWKCPGFSSSRTRRQPKPPRRPSSGSTGVRACSHGWSTTGCSSTWSITDTWCMRSTTGEVPDTARRSSQWTTESTARSTSATSLRASRCSAKLATSIPSGSESSDQVTVGSWSSPHWRSSRRLSRSAWTSLG
jgi:hypothetical protein